jgi:phage shock protein A
MSLLMLRGRNILLNLVALSTALASTLPSAAASGAGAIAPGQTYKWTDDKGVVHYGDSVPAEYAGRERALLNGQGVEVGHVDALKTPAQLAAQAQAEELARQRAQRDQTLLSTYVSVKDIEALRDERLAQIDGQLQATSTYMESLASRLGALQERALQFKPYSNQPNARRMPDDLAEDLVRTANELRSQRTGLDAKHQEQSDMRAQFESDIQRFRELTTKTRS